jgi:hypothetical protein
MARKKQAQETTTVSETESVEVPEVSETQHEIEEETVVVSETPKQVEVETFKVELSFNSGVEWSTILTTNNLKEAETLVEAKKAKYKAFGFTGACLRINGELR